MRRAGILIFLAAGLLGCPAERQEAPPGADGGAVEPAILEACREFWPEDECGAGECAETAEEAVYVGAFGAWLEAIDTPIADHAALRRVEAYDTHTEVAWHADIGWARVVRTVGFSDQGDDPQVDGIVDQLNLVPRLPAVDPYVALRPFAEPEAEVEACGEELGVTFGSDGWCRPEVPVDPLDDFVGVLFRFYEGTEDGLSAMVVVDATGTEPTICRLEEDVDR